jgi:hypothetical protein
MKKFLLLCVIGLVSFLGFSQSQRYVLFEEFTNASCGPCAQQNPAFQAIMASNTSKCTYVTYHWNYPGPNDPMYLADPDEIQSRIGYYGFNFVPSCVMDGITVTGGSYAGAPANVNQSMINNEYAVVSPFELYINQQLSPSHDSIYVTMLGKCTQAVSGQLVAIMDVVEKHIHYNTAPGSNGEKDFYNVMRKMLPSASGYTLSTSYEPGDYFILTQAWKLANIITLSELNVCGFIQNKSSKSVQQAAVTSATPITGVYPNDVELSSVEGVMGSYCVNSLSPVLKIRNNGSNPLTSVTFHCMVNSGNVIDYQWTGNLGFLETATVQFPAFDFDITPNNELSIYADGTNLAGDDYTKNDSVKMNFTAPYAGQQVSVIIKTNNAPQETTWNIQDISGNTIASGGPYTQNSHVYTQNVDLVFGTCYQFNIFDSGGNGICCGSTGNGFYMLKNGSTTMISGNSFLTEAHTQFYSASGVGIPENNSSIALSVYPNPVSATATVSFQNSKQELVSIRVFNMHGAVVLEIPTARYNSGSNEVVLDFSKLASGVYNLQLNSGDKIINRKITVAK